MYGSSVVLVEVSRDNTQNKGKDVSSSRKEGEKMERDVGWSTSNCLIADLRRTPKDPQPA